MPKRRRRRTDKSARRISVSGVWFKCEVLRTLRDEVTAALLSDDQGRDGSNNNASVYRSMLDPIDAELARLRQLAIELEARDREEIRQKAQILQDAIDEPNGSVALHLARSLAKDIMERL